MSPSRPYLRRLPDTLARELEIASPFDQRRFAVACTRRTAKKLGFSSAFQEELSSVDRAGPDQVLRQEKLVEELDAVAFSVREAEEQGSATRAGYLSAFAKARVANAILVLMEDLEPLTAAARSAYECHGALGEWCLIAEVAKMIFSSPVVSRPVADRYPRYFPYGDRTPARTSGNRPREER